MRIEMDNNLLREFDFFTMNHDDLFAKYPNKFIVLKDCSVILMGDSFEEAYAKAESAGLTPGTFLIQECSEGDSAYTQFFSTQMVFA